MKHEHLAEGWHWVRFDEIAYNLVERNGDNTDRAVMAVTKYDGLVPSLEYFDRQVYSDDLSNYKVVHRNQFAYAVIHLDEGSIGMNKGDEAVLVSPVYVVFALNEEQAYPPYFQFLLKSDFMMRIYQSIGEGTVDRRKSITFETLGSAHILLPPIDEQRRIAQVLRDADANIAQVEAQIEAAKESLHGALQLYFNDIKQTDTTRVNRVLQRIRREVDVDPNATYREIGIRSHGRGIFHKEPVTGKELGNKSVYWVEPGDFVLNIVFAWEGAVALVSEAERGMCGSHRFPTYEVNHKRVYPDYFLYYFKSFEGVTQLLSVSPGGAGRNKTLNQSDFMKLKIPLPDMMTQCEIASTLQAHDNIIVALLDERDRLKEVKRGLMQKLLSGEVRV